jgi:hypothetical protein
LAITVMVYRRLRRGIRRDKLPDSAGDFQEVPMRLHIKAGLAAVATLCAALHPAAAQQLTPAQMKARAKG